MNNPSAILMGSKPGSVVALETMLDRGWDVPCVVASEGISHDWFDGPTLTEAARSAGIDVVHQRDLSADMSVDFVISYMYRHLVKAETLELSRKAAVNFHPAPLPRFGGWAFYNVAILEDCKQYGVTCHHMDIGFDTGPLLKVKMFDVDCSQQTAVSLERESQQQMIALFCEFVLLAERGEALPKCAQDEANMRYMTKGEFAALKQIPETATPEEIDRIARAFWYPPYECAYVMQGESRVEVVPELAKQQIAEAIQFGVYSDLRAAARRNQRATV